MYSGLVCSTIGLFLCIFYKLCMRHHFAQNAIQEKRLSFDLVSIEDYSVTGKISKNLYNQVTSKTEPAEGDVPIEKFKKYLADQI